MKSTLIAATLIVIIIIAMVVLFVFNVIPWKSGGGGGTPVTYGVLMGKVTDKYGYPISNVTVNVGGQTAMTNDQGWYTVPNIAP
jgi:hypothetical protein